MKIKFPSKRKIKRFFKKIIKIIETPERIMPWDYVNKILIEECLHEDPYSGRGSDLFNEWANCLGNYLPYRKKEKPVLYIEPKEWVMLDIALIILKIEPTLHRYNDVDEYTITMNSFGRWFRKEAPLYHEACKRLGIFFNYAAEKKYVKKRKQLEEELHKLFIKAHKGKKLPEAPRRLTLTEKVYDSYKKEFSDQSRYHIVIPPTIAQVRSECAYPGQKLINTDDTDLQIPLKARVSDDGYIEKRIRYSEMSNVAVYEKTNEHIWDILYPAWGKELREGKRQYRKD